jgi:hypothetical protein
MDLSMPDKLKGFRHSLSLLRAAAIFWTSTTLRADPYASPIFGMLKTAMINSDKEVVGPTRLHKAFSAAEYCLLDIVQPAWGDWGLAR